MTRAHARISARIRSLLAAEEGFTILVVLGILTVSMGLGIAAFAAAGGDIHLSRNDQDQKRAYAAAEAGVQEYFFHLTQNNGYWAQCADPGGALNQVGSIANTKAIPRSESRYAIELLPANGYAACDPNNAQASMIVRYGQFTNTFSIRSTGISRNVHRSIVATFRRRSFIDYLYYTDLETADPVFYSVATNGAPTRSGPGNGTWDPNGDYTTWAAQNCSVYWRDGRGSLTYPQTPNTVWEIQRNGRWVTQSGTLGCIEMRFQSADSLDGPSHTNDDISICGAPVFGRSNDNDPVELSGSGWRAAADCNGAASPVIRGQWKPDSPLISAPPTNTGLKAETDPTYLFRGETTIVMNGSTMIVTNAERGLVRATMALPPEGLVYVDTGTGGCGLTAYDPLDPYRTEPGCGNVYLSGTYAKDLTIAAAKDIVIMSDILKSGDRMLGLIANNFVRVYHTVTDRDPDDPLRCRNDYAQQNLQIWAAIVALQHSFVADNYYCGSPLGTLRIDGALAQRYRGQVGRSDATTKVTGYAKKYVYDDRLRLREPPHFLDPVQASWRIQRYAEQVPPQ
jgi:Tfp pilus assembly protein PilX